MTGNALPGSHPRKPGAKFHFPDQTNCAKRGESGGDLTLRGGGLVQEGCITRDVLRRVSARGASLVASPARVWSVLFHTRCVVGHVSLVSARSAH